MDSFVSEGIRDGVALLLIGGGMTLMRHWLLKELRLTRAAVFRLLKSNRRQNKGIVALWECFNQKKCNGDTEKKIRAVEREEDAISDWVRAASMGQIPPEQPGDEED